MKIRAWHTFSTDILAYLDLNSNVIIGITRTTVAIKLNDVEYFILFPKDSTRHKKNIFKSQFQKYYNRKNELEPINNNFLVNSFAKIVFLKELNFLDKQTESFFELINDNFTWTINHLRNYALGTNTIQSGVKLKKLAIFIIRVYKLNTPEIIERIPKPRVSNQYFNIILSNNKDLNPINPIYKNIVFNRLRKKVESLYEEIFT